MTAKITLVFVYYNLVGPIELGAITFEVDSDKVTMSSCSYFPQFLHNFLRKTVLPTISKTV
jgi:hypothetical protein